jgi:UDP-glucose 4-epimerase
VELDLRAAHEMFGLDYVIFRPHNVYGEHQNIGDRYRNVIGIFMNQIMNGEPLSVFGDGRQTRAFSYIDDVAPQIAASVCVPAAYNQVVNIGADTPYSVNELAAMVGKAFGVAPKITHLPPRNEVVHAYSSHAKAQQLFGSSNAISLEDGIARMAAWAQRVGARESSTFTNIEVRRALPPSWQR